MGKLQFRGGIELRSSDEDFGGLSGLLVADDGRSFLAVTDQSHWVTGTLQYNDDGTLEAAKGGTIAPMLDPAGRPLADKEGDAEGLASANVGNGTDDVFVSFEVDHRLWRYALGKEGLRARAVNVPLPPELMKAPRNGGIEGITRAADGVLFAVSERFRDHAGNFHAWTLPFGSFADAQRSASAAAAGTSIALASSAGWQTMSIRPIAPFSITDVRRLPNGDVLTLERRYNPVDGVGMQMRRMRWTPPHDAAAPVAADAPLDGEVLISLDAEYQIDNMEGLSVRRAENGEMLVYIVSDDNFNRPIQRTLLLMFAMVE